LNSYFYVTPSKRQKDTESKLRRSLIMSRPFIYSSEDECVTGRRDSREKKICQSFSLSERSERKLKRDISSSLYSFLLPVTHSSSDEY
jgi:hypothetical protein